MVRVATLNLRSNANRWDERFPMIVDSLIKTNADVIGLQEVRLKIEQHQLIADAMNAKNNTFYTPFLCEDWYEPHILANAFLVRIPVIEHERIELPEGYRTAQRVLIDVGGQPTNIVNTHLHHKPYRDEKIRYRQMETILSWMDNFTYPFVLMGDMNARPYSETIALAFKQLQSAHKTVHGSEPSVTFPTPLRASEKLTPRAIDYILYDDAFVVQDCKLVGGEAHPDDDTLYLSDHFGLVANLDLA